jgi:hypothetical protein
MDRQYLDFELEMREGNATGYDVVVVKSPAGETRTAVTFPFGELELKNHLQALQIALLRSGGNRRRILTPEEQTVKTFGQALFDMVMTGTVGSLYYESQREAAHVDKGLRVKLRIHPPELASLPWEFLFDPRRDEYICLSSHTPLVRYPDVPRPSLSLQVTPPLRILGMVASPQGLEPLDIPLEKQRVEIALQTLQAEGRVQLTWLAGQSWRDLQQALWQGTWHIFHFIGHGGFDSVRDEGVLMLADDDGEAALITASQLGQLLTNHRALRLALLNSCDGARGSDLDIFSSTAGTLMRRGLPAVVAMQYEITDQAAIEFAQTFYKAVADGLPVDTAVAEARVAMSLALPNTLEWGTPVLYMRAQDGRVFTVQDVPRHAPQPENMTDVPVDTRVAEPEHSVAEEVQEVIQAETPPPAHPIDEPLLDRLKHRVGQTAWRFVLLWILATTVGFVVGLAVAYAVAYAMYSAVGSAMYSAVAYAMYSAVFGAMLGIGQWLVLRKRLSQAEWWILATTVGAAVGAAVVIAVADAVGSAVGMAVAVAVAVAVYGVVTGVLLFWLLQHPIQGEGSEREF